MQKGNKFEGIVVNPFSDGFGDQWEMWKQYRKAEHNFTYKSPMSEQAALNMLVDLSEGDEEHAIRIMMQSMSRGWMGFFKLHNPKKDKKDGKPESTGKAGKQDTGPGAKTISIDKAKDLHARRYGNQGQAGDSAAAK